MAHFESVSPVVGVLDWVSHAYGEVAPEIFPYRKTGRPWRIAEVSPQGFRAGMRHSSDAWSESESST